MPQIIDTSKLLRVINPTLASQWHQTLNTELSLDNIYANSGKKAWWQCSTCNYEWEAQIASRNGGRGCPNCAGKVFNETNSLAGLHPQIASQWHPTKNIKTPEKYGAISHYKAWWACDSGHEWQAMIFNRVRQNDGCPFCSGRYASPENNLAVVYPQLAKEFDIEKNFPLTPDMLTPSTPKKLWWKCQAREHSWKTSANSRTGKGRNTGCPYCVGMKAGADNNLSVTDPKIANEYHTTLNTDPVTTIRRGSRKLRWWICSKQHVWEMSPAQRTGKRKSSCLQCSPTPRTSKIEKEILNQLATNSVLSNINVTKYSTYVNLLDGKRAEIDIYGIYNSHQIVIEYDSWYWHGGRAYGEGFQKAAERDTRKTNKLLTSGYVVLRIRESRKEGTLPFLKLEHPHLHQINWNQNEGMEALMTKIQQHLRTL